jgi:hypothetical protein
LTQLASSPCRRTIVRARAEFALQKQSTDP